MEHRAVVVVSVVSVSLATRPTADITSTG